MKRPDMGCPMSNNALPLMMQPKFIIEAAFEAASFTDVDRVPTAGGGLFEEHVNARPIEVLRSQLM